MTAQKIHFSDLADYHSFLGLPAPEHPLFSVASISAREHDDPVPCVDQDLTLSSDFYSISLKHITSGELFYGRTKYDCKNGTMLFMAPKQEVRLVGLQVESSGRAILFHEDFIRGHPIKDEIKKYNYFGYAVNEALHLSPKEEEMVSGLIDQIAHEYHSNPDEFSKDLILSLVDTLLKYANRFYHRQFLHRKESRSDLLDRFVDEVEKFIGANKHEKRPFRLSKTSPRQWP